MNDKNVKTQATSFPAERENVTSSPPQAEELESAIEQVLEYLEAERTDYEACVQTGEDAEHHIYHAVGVLADWLGQQQQARDSAAVQVADIPSDRLEMDDARILLPESIIETIPPLYATENDPDPVAMLKLFTPDSSWTWYVLECDNSLNKTCFGLVDGLERELGYFSLAEIETIRGPWGFPVQRDLHFSPTPLTELYNELDRGR